MAVAVKDEWAREIWSRHMGIYEGRVINRAAKRGGMGLDWNSTTNHVHDKRLQGLQLHAPQEVGARERLFASDVQVGQHAVLPDAKVVQARRLGHADSAGQHGGEDERLRRRRRLDAVAQVGPETVIDCFERRPVNDPGDGVDGDEVLPNQDVGRRSGGEVVEQGRLATSDTQQKARRRDVRSRPPKSQAIQGGGGGERPVGRRDRSVVERATIIRASFDEVQLDPPPSARPLVVRDGGYFVSPPRRSWDGNSPRCAPSPASSQP